MERELRINKYDETTGNTPFLQAILDLSSDDNGKEIKVLLKRNPNMRLMNIDKKKQLYI